MACVYGKVKQFATRFPTLEQYLHDCSPNRNIIIRVINKDNQPTEVYRGEVSGIGDLDDYWHYRKYGYGDFQVIDGIKYLVTDWKEY